MSEEIQFEVGKQYKNRQGETCRILAVDMALNKCIIGVIGDDDAISTWDHSGRYRSDRNESCLDLIAEKVDQMAKVWALLECIVHEGCSLDLAKKARTILAERRAK